MLHYMILPEADCLQLPHQTLHHHLYTCTHKLTSATRHRDRWFFE